MYVVIEILESPLICIRILIGYFKFDDATNGMVRVPRSSNANLAPCLKLIHLMGTCYSQENNFVSLDMNPAFYLGRSPLSDGKVSA